MIVYPEGWEQFGRQPTAETLKATLLEVLRELGCHSLCLSGGVDSSLILAYLTEIFGNVTAYTIGSSSSHPDVVAARQIVTYFQDKGRTIDHYVGIPTAEQMAKSKDKECQYPGDEAVFLLYRYIALRGVSDSVLSCDGIDELACGYYDHERSPTYATYFQFLHQLTERHLIPLDRNSGNIQVKLPYLDSRIVGLLGLVPLEEKLKAGRKGLIYTLASEVLPTFITERRKYGMCDALTGGGE